MAWPWRPGCQDCSHCLLADVAFKTGKACTGISGIRPGAYGSTDYLHITESVSDVIRVHSNIYHPDYVVVVDETLLHTVDVTAGLKEAGGYHCKYTKINRRDHAAVKWL